MKIFTNIVKALVALAAVAGAVYAVATYGDKIVAWAKKLLKNCPCSCDEAEAPVEEAVEEPTAEEAAEEVPAEEPAAEEAVEEVPAEAPAAEEAPIADDADFVG